MSNNLKSLEELTGLKRITKKILLNLCKKNQLYQTPRLNDVLYLHYQGFRDIEGLEEYTGLKCLWLECNAISEIKNLTNQPLLKCLFLQNNLVRKIENLNDCPELDTINLSHNHIASIENCGIDVLPVLTNLNLANNYIRTCDGLKGLLNCKMLSVLDLSNNRLEDVLCVKIFSNMPELRVLILQGNPVVGFIPQYRKTLILECHNLTYLDSRPVFPKDRACAEAWKRGGYEEERAEHERWVKEDQRKMRENVNSLIRLKNSFKNGKQQQVKLLTSDDEKVKTDDDTSSSGSSSDTSDTDSSESSLENETETDNEQNNTNDKNLVNDVSQINNTTDKENPENLIDMSNTVDNSEQQNILYEEENETNEMLKQNRKRESDKTLRKCKEHKKSNESIWPKKYLLCEEPEAILNSVNIFDETLVIKEETESSTIIVEEILSQIISQIEIHQEPKKNPVLDLKNYFSTKQPEENQHKNLEIEEISETKYYDDLIHDLKSPIVLEEQNQNDTTELEENEEFTPEEFNNMMDILKQNGNECAADNVTSVDPELNIFDTELTSSEALPYQNCNNNLTLEGNENFMEPQNASDLKHNHISDEKEIDNRSTSELSKAYQKEIATLKEKELEEMVVLSDQIKNKMPEDEESKKIHLVEEHENSIEILNPLNQKQNEIYKTEESEKIEDDLDLESENRSSLMFSDQNQNIMSEIEKLKNSNEVLGLTEENQSKLLQLDTDGPEKSKQNFNMIIPENKQEILEIEEYEEVNKPVNLNVEETFYSLPSEQIENVISETDEYEEFKETNEQFSSDDENFKTSSDFGSNMESDTQTDNEYETEHNYNANDQSLKEIAKNLIKIENDLNEMNLEEQLHEEVRFSKNVRVTRSEMNRRKSKAHNKLSNNRDWLRKYLLQEEPEDVLATAITYHKTLIDFQLKWNSNDSEKNQTETTTDNKNFTEEVTENIEFQSSSFILEEIQKNISEAHFESEHQNFGIKSYEVDSEQNQTTTLKKEE